MHLRIVPFISTLKIGGVIFCAEALRRARESRRRFRPRAFRREREQREGSRAVRLRFDGVAVRPSGCGSTFTCCTVGTGLGRHVPRRISFGALDGVSAA